MHLTAPAYATLNDLCPAFPVLIEVVEENVENEVLLDVSFDLFRNESLTITARLTPKEACSLAETLTKIAKLAESWN